MKTIYEIFLNQMITMIGYRVLIILASSSPGSKIPAFHEGFKKSHSRIEKTGHKANDLFLHLPESIQELFINPKTGIPVFSKTPIRLVSSKVRPA
ncbi:MAG TPA: hypothetical protein VFG29_08275 [Syntrophales bacterium]|nr:hypothetical protein [Syntrophales bacterium]